MNWEFWREKLLQAYALYEKAVDSPETQGEGERL